VRAEPWLAIVNPAAGAGRGARAWPALERACAAGGVPLEPILTRAPGHASELVALAHRRGRRRFLAVGGDGTLNEVVNGLPPDGHAATLAVAPLGSGNDWARGNGVPARPAALARMLLAARTARHDVGRAHYSRAGGGRDARLFLNVAGAGYDADVIARLPARGPRELKYLWTALAGLPGYRARRMCLEADALRLEAEFLVVFAAIGRFGGGGLRLAPGAVADDRLLELVAIRALPWVTALVKLPKLYLGTLAGDAAAVTARAARIRVAADRDTPVEADGQLLGLAPLEVELLAEQIEVVVP